LTSDPAITAALREARHAAVAKPRSGAAWGHLGVVFLAHGFGSQARSCLARAEQLDPREPRWPYLQAIILVEDEPDPQAALPKLLRTVEVCRDDPPAPRLRLAELLLSLGRLDEAQTQFGHLLGRQPEQARAHLGLARVALEQGNEAACRMHLQGAIASPYTRKAALGLLAAIDRRQSDREAQRELGQLNSVPDDLPLPDPYLEEYQDARVGLLGELARATRLQAQQRLADAITVLRRLVHDYPTSVDAWQSLGNALNEQNDYDGAAQALEQALTLNPESVQAHYALGLTRFGQGRRDQAIRHFQEAVARKPDFALAYFSLARCLQLEGQKAAAIDAFREVVRIRPPWAEAHRLLALALAEDGQVSEARKEARLALDLNATDKEARQLLERLEKKR
jgi:tetratricopeptide (TPR) repeat protein